MKYYVKINDNHTIAYLSEGKINEEQVIIDFPDDFDVMQIGHYFIKGNTLIKMTEDEWKSLNPLWNTPILNKEQMLQAQVDVLKQKNKDLENCILELSNAVYSN